MAAHQSPLTPQQARLVSRALRTIESVWSEPESAAISGTDVAVDYFRCRIGLLPHEELHAAFLNAQNRLIAVETMFRGTLTECRVHPREVLKSALRHNAASVIVAHNHPSGTASPSNADHALTRTLIEALSTVEITLLDHIIVSPLGGLSMRAECWPEGEQWTPI